MGNKWIIWRGGTCPLKTDTWIDIKCRDGRYYSGCLVGRGAIVAQICWDGPEPFIVKYRPCAPRSNPHKGSSKRFWEKRCERRMNEKSKGV